MYKMCQFIDGSVTCVLKARRLQRYHPQTQFTGVDSRFQEFPETNFKTGICVNTYCCLQNSLISLIAATGQPGSCAD